MYKKRHFFTIICLLTSLFALNAQNEMTVDSLVKKSYLELYTTVMKLDRYKDSAKVDLYARAMVRKGEAMKKTKNLLASKHGKSIAFHLLANNAYMTPKSLVYADSIIETMGDISYQRYPAVAYQIKGDYFFAEKSYKEALNNFLLLAKEAQKANDEHMLFRTRLSIADLRKRFGDLDEALKLHKENIRYIETTKDSITPSQRLNTISLISDIYNDKREIDSAKFYNGYGMQEARRFDNELYTIGFALNGSITNYHQRNFETAIDSFTKYIPLLTKYPNSSKLLDEKLAYSHFYAGKSNIQLGNMEVAIEHFKSIDSIFNVEQNLFPDVRESYEYLIKYYKNKKDEDQHLYYLNQTIKIDSIIYEDRLFLNRNIVLEYDVPKLKFEKQILAEEKARSERRSKIIMTSLIALIVILIIALIIQFRKRQRFKRKFQEIINTKSASSSHKTSVKKTDFKTIDIQENVVKDILKGLDDFERSQGYLSKKITLTSLSKKLGTNPNYLSKVINHYKQSSFTKYLNTLRVEHSIEQLKNNSTYRKYTIKAIAEEVGFNSVQSFAKAFYQNKGINPSYFVKELQKSIQLSDK